MIGYCTIVHAGYSLDEVIHNLHTYSDAVQHKVGEKIELGLWLSNVAVCDENIDKLQESLCELNLTVKSINGFPYGNFHRIVVAHDVYKPSWCEEDRLSYTKQLALFLAKLLPDNSSGSISTLPLGWGNGWINDDCAAKMLLQCVDFLEELEQTSSRLVHLDIEPEPGCRLQTSNDLVQFVQKQFGDDQRIRRYLQVCYDTCHASVMREDPNDAINKYEQAGLTIGKVQLSSAIDVNFDELNSEEKKCAANALRSLAEPRYLHQTTVIENNSMTMYENLTCAPLGNPSGHWRVHFHVPIHKKTIGPLGTTQDDLRNSIRLLPTSDTTHWEVETYTWDVMPCTFQDGELIDSIAAEIKWGNKQIQWDE
ncbi:metabolite traffic protein EboE [PVC group bacterium]|nr:metabolite traffic protein EboE [PVC group bacterium]